MPAKRGGRGKKGAYVECPKPAEPSPPYQQRDESPQSQASVASSPSKSTSHSPIQPQKKVKTVTDLTVAQEEDMASWLEENELLYNKKLNAYKDFKKKDALWESKAATIGKDVQVLKIWYRSIRTRFTRLAHRKSGDGASELTERDRWILTNFAWLRVHVVEVQKKTTMKEKIAAAVSVDDGNDDQSEDPTETESVSTTRQRREPFPRRSSTKKVIQEEEERLLGNIAAREEQSIAFQTKVLEMLAPSKATERIRYADWAKEVMLSLQPSLWLKFQRECTNLLQTYQEKNEELLHPVTQQQYYPAQQSHYSTQQQQQYQFDPRQPPPHQWPSNVQQNMSLWRSQNSPWVQGQMTELQPMTTVVRGPSPAALSTRPTNSAVSKSPEPALSLSKIISDTIGIPDGSLENADATLDK